MSWFVVVGDVRYRAKFVEMAGRAGGNLHTEKFAPARVYYYDVVGCLGCCGNVNYNLNDASWRFD